MLKKSLLLSALLVLAALVWFWFGERPDNTVKLFYNGTILTMNPAQPRAEQVLIKGDEILAVGSAAELAGLSDANTVKIDLGGGTLMPGLIEPHTHVIAAALLASWVDVSGFTNANAEAVWQRLRDAVSLAEPGAPIYAFGLDPLLTPDLVIPDRYFLDQLAPDNPLFILSQVMHTGYANSMLLAHAGVDRNTPDPQGGHFEHDVKGEPTGVAHEEAVKLLLLNDDQGLIDKLWAAWGARNSLIAQYQRFADAGYTTIGVPGPVPMFEGYLGFLEHVATRKSAPLRSFIYPMSGEIEKTDYHPGYRNGNFSVLGVKLHLDGSPWTGGMATAEPYLSNEFTANVLKISEDHLGILKYSEAQLNERIEKYHREGWQISVHTHGERAHDMVLSAFERVQKEYPAEDRRHRLEHLGLITEASLRRAAAIGVTPSFFIDHIYYFGGAIENTLLGAERAQRFMPLKAATDSHEHVTIHTDNPATPIGPFRALQTAVTRIPRGSDQPLNAAQQMSVGDALEAITIDAAWQLHAEDRIGSIEVGKQADLVWLSSDPTQVSPSAWQDIQALGTWLAGQRRARFATLP